MGLPSSNRLASTESTSLNLGINWSSVVVAVGSNCPTVPRAITTARSHMPMVIQGLAEHMRARDSVNEIPPGPSNRVATVIAFYSDSMIAAAARFPLRTADSIVAGHPV